MRDFKNFSSAILIATLVSSSVLFFIGSESNLPFAVFLASLSFIVMFGFIIFRFSKLSQFLSIFFIVVVPLTVSLAYELLSSYPLGQDVHAEHHVITSVTSNQNIQLGSAGEYSDAALFLLLYDMVEQITGLSLVGVIKYFTSFVIGLIPLFVYCYVSSYNQGRFPSFIASIFILIQFSFVVTLHSTFKQGLALALLPLMLLTLVNQEWCCRIENLVTYLLLTIGMTGFHYTTSAFVAFTLFSSVFANVLLYKPSAKRERSKIFGINKNILILFLPIVVWIGWYVIFSKNIVLSVVNILSNTLSFRRAGYYDYIALSSQSTTANIIRIGINYITVLVLIVGTYDLMEKEKTIRNHMSITIIASAVFLFVLNLGSEFLNLTTLGIGRTSLIFFIILTPVVYYGFRRLWLFVMKDSKTLFHLTALTIVIVFALRFSITLGSIDYPNNMHSNEPFYDPNYRFVASISESDIATATFLNKYISNRIAVIGTDLRGINRLYYIPELWSRTRIIYTYFFSFGFYESSIDLKADYIFLSSYNFKINEINAALHVNDRLGKYLPSLFYNRNLVFNSRLTAIFN